MGNSHSQHHQIPFAQWAHSYPRPRHGQPQVKVLPERVPPLQLRTTDNGAILQNGGTISCRKQRITWRGVSRIGNTSMNQEPGISSLRTRTKYAFESADVGSQSSFFDSPNSIGQEERIYRPRSSSAYRPPKPEELTLDKTRFGSEPDLRFHFREAKDQFGDNAVRQRISRSRKKYKAPPAPQNGMSSGMESSSPDLSRWETKEKDRPVGPCRKGRLFKTRAETSKKNATNVRAHVKVESETSRSAEKLDVEVSKLKEEKSRQNGDRMEKKRLKRCASQEVISTKKSLATPEFQAELLEAAQRLRPSETRSETRNRRSPPTGREVHSEARMRKATAAGHGIEIAKENDSDSCGRVLKIYEPEEAERKCRLSEPRPNGSEQKEKNERDVPFKKFYFGMKETGCEVNTVSTGASTNNVDKTNAEHMLTAVEKNKNLKNLYKSAAECGQEWEDTVDRFAANFQKAQMAMPNGNTTSCSSSFVSDPDEDVDGGIALQLRPTLPKKTLEIPRFSPTAAWRLLSSVDAVCSQAPSPGGSDDGPLLMDDGIRPPVPRQGLRSSHDKSGDSGISGDASPGGCQESSSEIAAASPKPPTAQNNKSILMAWTPQQDLEEEESSSEDFESPLDSSKTAVCQIPGARFSPRGQLFVNRDQPVSLSIQREDRLAPFAEGGDFKERNSSDLMPRLNSLKGLKVTLGTSKRSDTPNENGHSTNENWVLSRSVPGSLSNGHAVATRSVSDPSSPEQDEDHSQQASLNYTSYSYLANGGRIMYLPEYHSRMSPDVSSGIRTRSNMCNRFLSKSCENVTRPEMKQVGRSRSPSPVGIRNRSEIGIRSDLSSSNQKKKKKFTFQSTVRLLENRRIAEKLSREAELKENQRLSELEAMKKVEEEFQKKRAREKANIRHQLRMFSLEEKTYSSLPSMDWVENCGDSAPSSLPQVAQNHSPRKLSAGKKPSVVDVGKFTPTTQILSEYKEPTRDYKDYRHSRYYESQELPSDNGRSVVEHPRMVYDMPKNMPVYVSVPANSCGQSQFKEDTRMGMSTPRSTSSDNYRKGFAHGALLNLPGKSLTSSDSELSQPHPRSLGQGHASRRFTTLLRNRSVSPDDLTTATTNPPERFDSLGYPSRRGSISPKEVIVGRKSRSSSPTGGGELKKLNHSPLLEKQLTKHTESAESKLFDPEEPQSEASQVYGTPNKHEFYGKAATDSLLRFGLPSLQPFNKGEKSFRPIKFNPVVNKLAQTVT